MADSTPQLYDPGEEDWELRVHVGCGSIYLEGYKNADLQGYHPYENEQLVEDNKTTIKDYWARKTGGDLHLDGVPTRDKIALDLLSDPRSLPYGNNVDKIVCIGTFEHFTLGDARKALLNWWNCMRPDGIVVISVPDPVATAQLLEFDALAVRQWAIKHLMGDGFNAYALHHWSYTEEHLRNLLTQHGFADIHRLEGIHHYPCIVLKARKADPWVPARSYQKLPRIDEEWRVLDIGPGTNPFKSATDLLDVTEDFRDRKDYGGKEFHLHDANERLPFEDDEFDFVYCSNVLEHLKSPIFGLEEAQRVGRRGYVEVPSMLLDFILHHGKTHKRWACWGDGYDSLIFIEKTSEQNKLFLDFDSCWGAFFHHALHGARLTRPQQAIRFFFWENLHRLYLMAQWDKEKNIGPIEAVELKIRPALARSIGTRES